MAKLFTQNQLSCMIRSKLIIQDFMSICIKNGNIKYQIATKMVEFYTWDLKWVSQIFSGVQKCWYGDSAMVKNQLTFIPLCGTLTQDKKNKILSDPIL